MALIGLIIFWLGGMFLSALVFGVGGVYGFMFIGGFATIAVGSYLEGRVFKKSGP